jgi:hypothetical protein
VTKKKKNNLPGAGRVAEVVQHLPSKHETLKSQYHQRKKKKPPETAIQPLGENYLWPRTSGVEPLEEFQRINKQENEIGPSSHTKK